MGCVQKWTPLKAIAEKNSLAIIEDNAECFLGKYKEDLLDLFGDFCELQFSEFKTYN